MILVLKALLVVAGVALILWCWALDRAEDLGRWIGRHR